MFQHHEAKLGADAIRNATIPLKSKDKNRSKAYKVVEAAVKCRRSFVTKK
jgi:hypothetical protein